MTSTKRSKPHGRSSEGQTGIANRKTGYKRKLPGRIQDSTEQSRLSVPILVTTRFFVLQAEIIKSPDTNMKFVVSILAISAIASAAATPNTKRRTGIIEMRATSDVCGPLDTPMCCATDVLGIADLSCSAVPSSVTSSDDFTSYCAADGKSAECCVTSLLGSAGLLCSAAV
ncbi:hypothetical protein QM012_005077 [Aureobasidium pullulans]|uniref:Hydrophobin n=1 Tax=Aureobasidium pullulans TaxID=5580 RepID=A0ABR0T6B7_AURPU